MEMKHLLVVGAGLMGSGIAQTAAQCGLHVLMYDVSPNALLRGFESIAQKLDRLAAKEKITASERDLVLSRITKITDLQVSEKADFVIEAVYENLNVKKEVFQKLDNLCPDHTIFATNTSSLSVTALAATVKRAEKFIGMHFFSPVPVMKIVEIVRGLKTSPETLSKTEEMARIMKKESVRVKDVPGFLVNRINNALRNEAYNCLMEGVASIEDIDKAMKLALNHPMGPFELADFVGLDVTLSVAKTLYEGYRDIRWRPNRIVENLVLSGDLGRKTGKGWYDYTSGQMRTREDIEF